MLLAGAGAASIFGAFYLCSSCGCEEVEPWQRGMEEFLKERGWHVIRDVQLDKNKVDQIKSSVLVQMIGTPESLVVETLGKCEPYVDDDGQNVYCYSTEKKSDSPFLMVQIKCFDKRVQFVSVEEQKLCTIHMKRP